MNKLDTKGSTTNYSSTYGTTVRNSNSQTIAEVGWETTIQIKRRIPTPRGFDVAIRSLEHNTTTFIPGPKFSPKTTQVPRVTDGITRKGRALIDPTIGPEAPNISITVFVSAVFGLFGLVVIVLVISVAIAKFTRTNEDLGNTPQGNFALNKVYEHKTHFQIIKLINKNEII